LTLDPAAAIADALPATRAGLEFSMHGLTQFLRSNVLAIALLGVGVVVSSLAGCGVMDLLNFSPRSAQAQGGEYSKTKSFEANAQLAVDLQNAGNLAQVTGNYVPFSTSLGTFLKDVGEQLAANTEALDEISKTRTIKQADVLQSQAGAVLVALGILTPFIRRKAQPGTPAAG
jgi:hypothetical protein